MGDRFLLLKRGASLGDFAKNEISLDELTRLMAGGAELEALSHELSRSSSGEGPSEMATVATLMHEEAKGLGIESDEGRKD